MFLSGLSDPCPRVDVVGDETDLPAGQADRLVSALVDGHGHEGDADLLAGGQEHIHLPAGRVLGDLAGQVHKIVGGIAHGADHDDHFVAFELGLDPINSIS